LTAQQPDNNVARVALQALAAVLGGAQSLHCNGRDEALALPTEESATLALRTQQILFHESGVASTADPTGGAYAVEDLTNQIEAEAVALITRIDALGGAVAAIESGFVQRQIQDAAYAAQQRIDEGRDIVVGVNRHMGAERTPLDVFRIDPAAERQQIERLRILRQRRNHHEWTAAIAAVERAARGNDNLMPAILSAVDKLATVGEVTDTLRRVFGEHRPGP
jgi:methylmalonyl-CoA mutase N-terminal domain/subunit